MTRIYPFRALRYDSTRVRIDDVVTQPYDKITPAMQDRYYARNPFNLVRIILGKHESGDDGGNVYTRAASYLSQWRSAGVLRPDPEPSIYTYVQNFKAPSTPSGAPYERRGFIALGQLEDYEAGIVFRHEQTLSGPKADRLNLLRATRAHCGQIFMLYSDPEQQIDRVLFPSSDTPDSIDRATPSPVVAEPDADVTDEYGVQHRLWRIANPTIIHRVQEMMLNRKLIIADGHHRYETAMNYRNEQRALAAGNAGSHAADPFAPSAPHEAVMMTFVNMDAPGLVILPTHRIVFGLPDFDIAGFVEQSRRFFSVNVLRDRISAETATSLLASRGQGGTALLVATATADLVLEAREDSTDANPILAGLSPRQRKLDVVQLHKILLEHVLGISEEAIRSQTNLRYVRDMAEALKEVRSGGANAAFLMNPVRMEQVRDIAFAGEVLPQKSTDFYPKLLSGLTIYAME